MYHRREKKDRVYTDSEVHVCNVSEVQAEHDEKREIVLDNTVKDNQSYLILGSTKKKNNPGYQIFSRMFDIGLAMKKLQIGMTFTYMNIKIFSFQSQCHFISIVTGCQL